MPHNLTGTNWAANIAYSASEILEPSTLEEVRSIVTRRNRLKPLGTRHCFNTIADTPGALVSLNKIADIEIDARAHTVQVGAGVTYGRLGEYLHEQGFALANFASLPHISIAGACSTATHGSGEHNGVLATAVCALQLVNGNGEIVELQPAGKDSEFNGAVVGLGALGIVTRLKLRIEPAYAVRQYVYRNLPLTTALAHFDAIQASAYSVSLFTTWRTSVIEQVWIKARDGTRPPFAAPADFFSATLARDSLNPVPGMPAHNCTDQAGIPGPSYQRLPHFRMGFVPSAGEELQSEYLVPREHGPDAILAISRLSAQIHPHLLVSEIRTAAKDDFWMSMCYGHPAVAIHFTWKRDWLAVRSLLPVIEKQLRPFRPRPHWGKLFAMQRSEIKPLYERLDDFRALAAKYDPAGKFRNDFLNALFFA
jgi:xylitol oxidase